MSNSNSLPNLSNLGKKRISFVPVVRAPEGAFYPLRNHELKANRSAFSAGKKNGRYDPSGPYENVPRANLWAQPQEYRNAVASFRSEAQARFKVDPDFLRYHQLKPQKMLEHRKSVRNRLAGPRINGYFVPPPGWNVKAAAGKTLKNLKKPSGINRRSVKQKSRK